MNKDVKEIGKKTVEGRLKIKEIRKNEGKVTSLIVGVIIMIIATIYTEVLCIDSIFNENQPQWLVVAIMMLFNLRNGCKGLNNILDYYNKENDNLESEILTLDRDSKER